MNSLREPDQEVGAVVSHEFYKFQPWQMDWQKRLLQRTLAAIRQQDSGMSQLVSIQQSSRDFDLIARLSCC